jgi:hypothetical protein
MIQEDRGMIREQMERCGDIYIMSVNVRHP